MILSFVVKPGGPHFKWKALRAQLLCVNGSLQLALTAEESWKNLTERHFRTFFKVRLLTKKAFISS